MDVLFIIRREGYRYEDLNERNKESMDWLKFLQKEFEDSYTPVEEYDEDSILGKMCNEIAGEVIEDIKRWLESTIADIQISMIEDQPDDV